MEAKARALVTKEKAIEVEEATKAIEAKVEEALFKAYKEIKSFRAKAKAVEHEASNASARV